MKVARRYYVSTPQIFTSDWAKPTLAEAVEQAERILEGDPHRRIIAIATITHVVKRKTAPVVVEKVR